MLVKGKQKESESTSIHPALHDAFIGRNNDYTQTDLPLRQFPVAFLLQHAQPPTKPKWTPMLRRTVRSSNDGRVGYDDDHDDPYYY